MANVVINDTHLNDIAAAIRSKNGSADTYKPGEMAAAINAISNTGGSTGETLDFDSFIGRTVSGEVEFTCTQVGKFALAGCSNITKLTVHGLAGGRNAFEGCTKLQELNLPDATELGMASCSGNTKLTTVNAPQVTLIDDYAFQNCKALTNTAFGNLTRINEYSFVGCSALTKIDLGNTEQAHYHYSLWIGPYIENEVFSGCNALTAIIIRGKIPCCVGAGCPFPAQFRADYEGLLEPGYIYVPRAMITEYQQYQANISGLYPYYNHFSMMNYRAIEDYPEICG